MPKTRGKQRKTMGRPRELTPGWQRIQVILEPGTVAKLDAARAKSAESRSAIARRLIEGGLS